MQVPRNFLHSLQRSSRIHTTCNRHMINTVSRGFSKCSSVTRSTTNILQIPQQAKFGRIGICGALSVRCQSTGSDITGATTQPASDLPAGYIPEPPLVPPEQLSETVLNHLGEIPLAAQGLCNYTPAGFVQWAVENLHVGLDIPWWGAIAVGTLIVRLCLFPLIIKSRKNAINMQNHMPTVTRLQEKVTRARVEGNNLKVMQITSELQAYMKRNNVRPFQSAVLPLCQLPIFMSVFVGLRAMANLPVESFKTGGLLWFTDLTLADPVLPFITAATLLITIEVGSDGVSTKMMTQTIKWVMRGGCIVMIPFMWKFPAALLCYWLTANLFSLTQTSILKIKGIQSFFNLPVAVKHDDAAPYTKKKKFIEGFRESLDNAKAMNRIEGRRQTDAISFKKAGEAPLVKTYAYNPKTANKAQSKQNQY